MASPLLEKCKERIGAIAKIRAILKQARLICAIRVIHFPKIVVRGGWLEKDGKSSKKWSWGPVKLREGEYPEFAISKVQTLENMCKSRECFEPGSRFAPP